jgi:translation initiation factor 3 subunit H
MEKLRDAGVSWKDVFDEIPIMVKNSSLGVALTASVESDTPIDHRDTNRLSVGVRPLLEKSLEFLNDCLDDIVAEQQKVDHSQQSTLGSLYLGRLHCHWSMSATSAGTCMVGRQL